MSASDSMAFVARLTCIWEWITELIREASALQLTYEGAKKNFTSILEWVGKEVKEYLDTQSTADCMTFMDESFKSLLKFSDAFNVLPFVPVVVGTAITHHLLLTSLQVNVLHIPLKIFLSPLTSNAMAALGQMALLSYMAQQSIAVWERQAQSKPILRTGTGEMDPTLESDHGSNAGLVPQKLKLDMVGLTPLKKDRLEARSSKTPMLPILPQNPPQEDTSPPLPPPSPARKHSTPKGQNTHPGGSVASLLAQFQQSQQSQLRDASPKNGLSKNTPMKDTPKKGEQMLAKKLLMPDMSAELPIKKQQTGSPSSERESKTDHNTAENSKKKKKKKKPKNEPTMATDSEAEETEERQEKCQWVRKWKQELKELQEYPESRNIFLHTVLEQGGGSHMGYLEFRILNAGVSFFFLKSFKEWQIELQKQSQGVRHSASSTCHRLQMLEQMYDVKLSSQYNMHAEYLVEVFKYPGTRNHISMDAADGYGSTPMIGFYCLVELYSIARITTMQSGVVEKDGKKKSTSKCYCSLCDYVVQNHPSINNHVRTHLCLSLLCTINGCFNIEHGCNDMWGHVTREHNIPSGHAVVPPSKKSKTKK